jgi:putative transposase
VRWSLDFLSDVFGPGRRSRILAVIDDFTRECLALVTDTSICGRRVARELDRIVRLDGGPTTIVSDNGAELTSRAMLEWQNGTGLRELAHERRWFGYRRRHILKRRA